MNTNHERQKKFESRSKSEVDWIRSSSRVLCSCGNPKCVIGMGFQGEVLRFVDQHGKESAMYLDASKTIEIFNHLIEYPEVKEHMINTVLNSFYVKYDPDKDE